MVSTSRWVSRAGRPATGGVRFPQISPRWGWKVSGAGPPVMSGSIQAPPGLALELFEKRERALSGVSHAILEHQIGEVAISEQMRFLAAQFQDAREQAAVVAWRLGGADRVGLVHVPANGRIVEVGHQR